MPVRKVFNQTISVLKYGRWGIPVVAVAAMLAALLDLPAQSCEEICTAGGLAGEFNRSSLTCLALGALLLGYWFAVDGRQHGAALVGRALAMTTGIPPVVLEALAKGARFMLGKIKRMAMEMEREEGRQEGKQEGRAEGLDVGRQEGRAEGLDVGREEGKQEGMQVGVQVGRQEAEAAFQAWIRRQQAAGNLKIDESDPPPR